MNEETLFTREHHESTLQQTAEEVDVEGTLELRDTDARFHQETACHCVGPRLAESANLRSPCYGDVFWFLMARAFHGDGRWANWKDGAMVHCKMEPSQHRPQARKQLRQ